MLERWQLSTGPCQKIIIGALIAVFILLLAHHHGALPQKAWFQPNFRMATAGTTISSSASVAPTYGHQQQQQSPTKCSDDATPAAQHVPSMLSSMLVCITFRWDPSKLVYLTILLRNVATYRCVRPTNSCRHGSDAPCKLPRLLKSLHRSRVQCTVGNTAMLQICV